MISPYDIARPGRRRIQVIGHRGWMARFPENTMAGFKAAVALGVDLLELDIHLSSDNRIVVIHDDNVRRTTDSRGAVRRMTLADLRRLDAGRWFDPAFAGERIPLLEEVMALADGRVGLAIEVKDPGKTADSLDERLIPLVRAFNGPVVVHSFDTDYVIRFKAKAPEICTGALCRIPTGRLMRQVREAGVEAIHPPWRTLTKRVARQARETGLAVMIWTARNRRDCLHMSRKDTDAIGADCPDILMEVLASRGRLDR